MNFRIGMIAAVAAIAAAGGLMAAAPSDARAPKPAAAYTQDGKLEFPKDYRTWVYLTSGFDMSYAEGATPTADRHVFDNVFVDRAAYAAFQQTGRWPEGSVFALEIRRAANKGSINKQGQFQTERAALELHVKDRRFPSGWAFFNFRGEAPATALPQTSACNACHEKHGAVDTTFVQFYPTLLPLAREKKSLSEAFLAEENAR
ncbi:cytochrome P460 family protein [Phenylobacterium sp.]|jgi:hypothetical protein|uniref:cytochrome P460 family protein n=1 Tax=Phenylobacterium sp. TaxID=1871053 RepID=UPI002F92CA1E